MTVKFTDPPEDRRHSQRKWEPLCAAVMKRPGEWAEIATLRGSAQAVNAVRSLRSRKVRYPEGDFEFRHSGNRVYARYLGAAG